MQIFPFKKYEFVETFNDSYQNQSERPFSIITGRNFLPSFVYKLSDFVYLESMSNFDIQICDVFDDVVFSVNSKSIINKICKISNSYFYTYLGDEIQCLDLDCGYYYCKIGDYYSDWFKVVSDLSQFTKIVCKSTFNTSELPYSLGFKQTIYLDHKLLEPEIITNTISDIDTIGIEVVSSVVYKKSYKLNIYNVPSNISHFFQHLESCTDVTVSYLSKSVKVMANQFKTKSTRDASGIGTFNCEISFVDEFIEKVNFCENDEISLVSEVKMVPFTECFEVEDDINVTTECIEDELTYTVTIIIS